MAVPFCTYKTCPNFGRYCRMIHVSAKDVPVKPEKEVSIPALIKKAQDVFNAWIRNRDKDKSCISCDAKKVEHAGHYYAVGAFSHLRFDEINTNGQCEACNCYQNGNLDDYRKGLLQKYSPAEILLLDQLSELHTVKKWSRQELESIIRKYTIKKK